MSTISLRLPDSLHAKVRELAEKEHVSINQLITLAVAEKVFERAGRESYRRKRYREIVRFACNRLAENGLGHRRM